MKKRLLLILISLSVCASGFSQDIRRLFFTAKAGASFGGSRPGSYNDNGEANLMINFTGAVGLSYFFANDWQVCLDIGYIRKGINCEVQPTDEIMDVYLPSHSLNGLNTDVFAWDDNT